MEKDKTPSNDSANYYGGLEGMSAKQFLGAIVSMIVRIALAAVIIFGVFRLAVGAYEIGYQVFADIPISQGEGRTVSVVVSEDVKPMALAKILEQKGLVADANIFFFQELFSDYRGEIKAGTYELSTAMTAQEMIRVMCGVDEEAEEE